jgi:hypothetical protein
VGNLSEPFAVLDKRVQRIRKEGFTEVCSHFGTVVKKSS